MQLKPGTKLRSAAGTTEVVVVKAPGDEIDLRCGGHPMVAPDDASADSLAVDPAFSEGSLLGKRYTDAEGTVELLCTKPGDASLSIGSEPLGLKEAKPLPSSD